MAKIDQKPQKRQFFGHRGSKNGFLAGGRSKNDIFQEILEKLNSNYVFMHSVSVSAQTGDFYTSPVTPLNILQ